MPKKFSESDIQLMKKMYNDVSNSYEDIAERLNCSKATIEKRAREHGWNKSHIIKQRIDIHYRPLFKINTAVLAQNHVRANRESREKWKLINERNLKICTICNQEKILDNFYKLPNACQNFKGEGIYKYTSQCRSCENKRVKKVKEAKSSTIEGRFEVLLSYVERRCRQKNLNHTLTKEFLLKKWNGQRGKCYYSGFNMSHGINDNLSVSIDRIDSNEWYNKDNIVLCCWLINNMKQELSQEEFLMRVKKVYEYKIR